MTVALLVATPPYTLLGRTIIGAAERDDGVARSAVLVGRRLDVDMGQRVTVRGRLRVVWHAPAFVSGTAVAEWWEIRVEE